MRPNFSKLVYYQYFSEVLFWKSGPESGPKQKEAGFYEKSWLATGEIAVIGEIPQLFYIQDLSAKCNLNNLLGV